MTAGAASPRQGRLGLARTFVAIHGNGRADAYSVFLFDDYEAVKDLLNASLGCLAFAHAGGAGEAGEAVADR